ncbi:hypothetical protein CP8484711_2438 [Chlamydia psittaci 84-8471/1]|nr:hypothetical protein CP8484711_2438 [Chlamydia psittaci 84-8471/1]
MDCTGLPSDLQLKNLTMSLTSLSREKCPSLHNHPLFTLPRRSVPY